MIRRWRVTLEDWRATLGGHIVKAIRSEDFRAIGYITIYVALATSLVTWGSYMVVLVKAIVGL